MRRFALLAVTASLTTLAAVPVVSSTRTDPMMQLSGADR